MSKFEKINFQQNKNIFKYFTRLISFSYSSAVFTEALNSSFDNAMQEFNLEILKKQLKLSDEGYTDETLDSLSENHKRIILKSLKSSYKLVADLLKFPYELPEQFIEESKINFNSQKKEKVFGVQDSKLENGLILWYGDYINSLGNYYHPQKFDEKRSVYPDLFDNVLGQINCEKTRDNLASLFNDKLFSKLKSLPKEKMGYKGVLQNHLNLNLLAYVLMDQPIQGVSDDLQQKIYEYYKPEQLKNKIKDNGYTIEHLGFNK